MYVPRRRLYLVTVSVAESCCRDTVSELNYNKYKFKKNYLI